MNICPKVYKKNISKKVPYTAMMIFDVENQENTFKF